jgi:hypothetical protein
MPLEIDDLSIRIIGNGVKALQFYDDSRVLQQEIYLQDDDTLNIGGGTTVITGDGSGSSVTDAQYLVLNAHDGLPNERVLTIGNGLAHVDGGAGANYQLAARLGTGLAFSSAQIVLAFDGTPGSVDLDVNAAGTSLYAARTDHHHQLDVSIAPTWTGQHTFQDTITARDVIPEATDAYDLGTSSKLWRKGYLSELETVLFALNTVTISGARQVWGHNAGTLAADLADTDDTADFGQAMTVGDFVEMRGYLQVEYFQVGSNVSGTVYRIGNAGSGARNLDGSGANNWPAGTPYLVLGASGDGRVEINAAGPNISILEQGATYNANTEYVRLGNMRNTYGTGAVDRYGFGVGDYAGGDYLSYNAEGAGDFILRAGAGTLVIDDSGIEIELAAAVATTRGYRLVDSGGSLVAILWGYFDATMQYANFYVDQEAGKDSWAVVSASAPSGNDCSASLVADHVTLGITSLEVHSDGYGAMDGDFRIVEGLYVGGDTAPAGVGYITAAAACSGWLPVATYAHSPSGITASPAYPYSATIPRDVYITTWRQMWYVATTNDGSHYWTVTLKRLLDDATIASWNTSAGSASTWSYQTTNIGGTTYGVGSRGFYVVVEKTGSPGALSLSPPALYAR